MKFRREPRIEYELSIIRISSPTFVYFVCFVVLSGAEYPGPGQNRHNDSDESGAMTLAIILD
jgi:hypothetical protein